MLKLERGIYLGTNKQNFHAEGVVISETEYTQKVFEGWHYHDNHHITFILKGGNREHRKNSEFEASSGKIIFYNSGELHRNVNTCQPSKNINLEVEDSFLNRYHIKIDCLDSAHFNHPDAKFAVLKIYQECKINDELATASIHALLLNLLSVSLQEKHDHPSPHWVKLIREIIHDHWNENLSLHDLAKILQLHPVTISKHFPQYFNCTLGDYTRKVKIDKAIELMGRTKLSLTEIAAFCGFFDQSHFIRAFKQWTGFLPGRYKKM